MTPARLHEIKERATLDARAIKCGYPQRAIPYQGAERVIYDQFYAEAAKAYGVKHK